MVYGNSVTFKSIGAIFWLFAYFVSLCHILIILAIFQTFHYHYICYIDLWSVIQLDVTIVTFGVLQTASILNSKLNWQGLCVSSLLHWPAIPQSLFLSLGPSIPWDTTILQLGQLITLQWPSSVQVKELHVSYFKLKARNDEAQWGRQVKSWDRPRDRPLAPNT